MRRPIFFSEADFHHELAWQIRSDDPKVGIRVERPIDRFVGLGAVDILVIEGERQTAIEVKYVKSSLMHECGGEKFSLPQHAFDFAAYDCCRDIERLEHLVKSGQADEGLLIVLTNHSGFWRASSAKPLLMAPFALWEGRNLTGTLTWSPKAGDGTIRGRKTSILISQAYDLTWSDYSLVGAKRGTFRSCVIRVVPNPA